MPSVSLWGGQKRDKRLGGSSGDLNVSKIRDLVS